jgi:peroxiredoxin
MIWKGVLALGATIALGAALLVSTTNADEKAGMTAAKVGAAAPAFELPDQNGKTVKLSDFAGKVVVLEWFNEDCPIVQRFYVGSTAMNDLAKKYQAKDVVWLAINSTKEKTLETNKAAAAKWNMDRPILSDPSGTVGHQYGATNTPGMYVIAKDGTLAYMGAIDDNSSGNKKEGVKNYVVQALEQVMSGQSVSEPMTKQYGCGVKYAN